MLRALPALFLAILCGPAMAQTDPTGFWFLDEAGGGRQFGQVMFDGESGRATLDGLRGAGQDEARLALRLRGPEAEDWTLDFDTGGTAARLILDRVTLRGTLLVDGTAHLVALSRPGGMPVDPVVPADDDMHDDLHEDDLPGFGIYAFEYALRGVPSDRTLWVRAAPQAGAEFVGQLNPTARGLFAFACTPEPDNIAFDTGTREDRIAMLDAMWCQVGRDGMPMGWVRGAYLDPIDR